jgi:hypothetical protein
MVTILRSVNVFELFANGGEKHCLSKILSIESVLYYSQRRTWLMQKTKFDEMDSVHGQKKIDTLCTKQIQR